MHTLTQNLHRLTRRPLPSGTVHDDVRLDVAGAASGSSTLGVGGFGRGAPSPPSGDAADGDGEQGAGGHHGHHHDEPDRGSIRLVVLAAVVARAQQQALAAVTERRPRDALVAPALAAVGAALEPLALVRSGAAGEAEAAAPVGAAPLAAVRARRRLSGEARALGLGGDAARRAILRELAASKTYGSTGGAGGATGGGRVCGSCHRRWSSARRRSRRGPWPARRAAAMWTLMVI